MNINTKFLPIDCTGCILTAITDFNENNNTGSVERAGGVTDVVVAETEHVSSGYVRFKGTQPSKSEYKGYAQHFVQIDHRVVTNANTGFSTLTDNLLNDFLTEAGLVSLTKPVGRKIYGLKYSRSKLRVRVAVQGQPFAAGQLVMAFTPMVGMSSEWTFSSNVDYTSVVNSKIVPHLIIDPSKVATYEIDLPVCTTTGVWDVSGVSAGGSYQVNLHYFNPVFSGTAVTATVGICTYCAFVEEDLEGLVLLSNDFESEKKPGGTLSSIVRGIGKYSQYLTLPFPTLAPEITLFSTVSSTVGDFLAYMGFSKPSNVENSLYVMNRQVDNWTQFDGKSTAMVLAGSQGHSLGLSAQHGGGNMDDMLLANICSKPGLCRRMTISPASASGTNVGILRLHPTLLGAADIGVGSPDLEPTPLAGVACCFAYWTGDLILDVEVVASVFHRCTLLVAWNAEHQPVVPAMEDAMAALHNTIITVAGNSRTRIRIPYMQTRPWSNVQALSYNQSAALTGFTNGTVYLYVVNALTSNGSTDSIPVNFYLSSDNIKFAMPQPFQLPGSINSYGTVPTANLLVDDEKFLDSVPEEEEEEKAEFYSADPITIKGEQQLVDAVMVEYGPKTDLGHATLRSFGEEYHSIKQLTSKVTSVSSYYYQSTPAGEYVGASFINAPFNSWPLEELPVPIPNPVPSASSTSKRNFTGWFFGAFQGYRGSFRHNIHWHTFVNTLGAGAGPQAVGNHQWTQSYHPPAPNSASVDPSATALTISGLGVTYAYTAMSRDISPVAEIIMPLMIPVDFMSRGKIGAARGILASYARNTKGIANERFMVEHFMGTGEDGVFVWFLGFPKCRA